MPPVENENLDLDLLSPNSRLKELNQRYLNIFQIKNILKNKYPNTKDTSLYKKPGYIDDHKAKLNEVQGKITDFFVDNMFNDP